MATKPTGPRAWGNAAEQQRSDAIAATREGKRHIREAYGLVYSEPARCEVRLAKIEAILERIERLMIEARPDRPV